MNGAFYIGATGLHTQQRALDVVANNIGNINTTAFKRSGVRFSELVTPVRIDQDGLRVRSDRTSELAGVTMDATPRIWTQGDLRQTGQSSDLAIDGAGFIEVMGPAGRTLLWRGGALKVSADGFLATTDGLLLRAMISVPSGSGAMSIDRTGVVTVETENGIEQIGQIDLTMVRDVDALTTVGAGYYESPIAAEVYSVEAGEEGGGTFAQGALEGSNVQLSDEMVTLLLFQRSFAANAQVVQAGDQLMSIVNSLRR